MILIKKLLCVVLSVMIASSINVYGIENTDTVSRAEAAYELYKISGINITFDNKSFFSDVDDSEPYSKYINFVYELGLMNGDENGFFNPNKAITPFEISVAILRLAGYGPYAEATGGYPVGYQMLINRFRVYNGIKQGYYDALTREDLKTLLNNTIIIPMCDMSTISSDGSFELKINESDTILSRNLGIERRKGRVCSTELISLPTYSLSSKGKVYIQSDEHTGYYEVGRTNAQEYIGCNVYFYTYKDSNTILYIEPVNKVNTIHLNAYNYVDISHSLSVITYEAENHKSSKALLSANTIYVYNGKPVYDLLESDFEKANTDLTLIDWNDDDIYDIVYVVQYENIWVEQITEESIVTNRINAQSYSLSDDDYEDGIVFLKNNIKASYSQIAVDMSISIAISRDGKRCSVYLGNKAVLGKVNSLDNNSQIVGIDDTEIRYEYLDASVGEYVLASENYFGFGVIVKQRKSDDARYMFVIKIAQKEDITETVLLKALDESGVKVYEADKKLMVNGKRCDYSELLNVLSIDGAFEEQLIRATIVNDRIKKIETSGEAVGYADEYGLDKFTLNHHFEDATVRMFGATINNRRYIMAPTTSVFCVAYDTSDEVNEEESFAKEKREITFTNTYSAPEMYVYDAGYDRIPKAVVVKYRQSKYSSVFASGAFVGKNIFVVSEKCITLDQNGDSVAMLKGMLAGIPWKFYPAEDISFDKVNVGDVLNITKYLDRNVIYSFSKVFAVKSLDDVNALSTLYPEYSSGIATLPKSTVKSNIRYIYGKVVEYEKIGGAIDSVTYFNDSTSYAIRIMPYGGVSSADVISGYFSPGISAANGSYLTTVNLRTGGVSAVKLANIDLLEKDAFFYINSDGKIKDIVLYE